MNKDELVKYLGTIANSGTQSFLKYLSENKSNEMPLIGKFGVGFYSSFMVADEVTVFSKKAGDKKSFVWKSEGKNEYSIEESNFDIDQGARVELKIKKSEDEYMNVSRIKNIIKTYSEHLSFPISFINDKGNKEIINQISAIWMRNPREIKQEEYENFYSHISYYSDKPWLTLHNKTESIEFNYINLLFIPKNKPFDLFHPDRKTRIKLYINKIFISEENNNLVPAYLRFIRGVVDSDDLPLNVSREQLQQHKLLKVIKKKLVRKTLDMIKKIDEKLYPAFWREFSTNIKLGVIEDAGNRSRLAKLVRFMSSAGELASLSGYVERMKDKQEQIFYMAGNTLKECQESPFVERLVKKGYEVLYLTEAVDEYAVSALPEFEGKKFQNVAKDGFVMDGGDTEASKAYKEELKERYEPLIKWMQEDALKDHILRAEISERLEQSPCALITSRFGWTANMQRIMKAQVLRDSQMSSFMMGKKKMEINPRHPIIVELKKKFTENENDRTVKDLVWLIFETAALTSGFSLKDPNVFAGRIHKLIKLGLSFFHHHLHQ
jgi:heat shock protein beta